MESYKCTNFGNCSKADSAEIITASGISPSCPECRMGLYPDTPLSWWNKHKGKVIGGVLALTTLGGVGAAISQWIEPEKQKVTAIVDNQTDTLNSEIANAPNQKTKNNKQDDAKKTSTSCVLNPITANTKSNWYGIIEIGAKGIKPIAIKFENNLKPVGFGDTFDTQDVSPKEEARIPQVVDAVCNYINQFHEQYGNLPIYVVGSSSMKTAKHREKLVTVLNSEIGNAIQMPIDFVTAEQEARYLGEGIWADPDLPPRRHCESAIIDIGSGNIKGGYVENCNPNVKKDSTEKFASFDIQDFGTSDFSNKAQAKLENRQTSTFAEAAGKTREELEINLDVQVRTRPELTNGKKRFYLAGGAVWIMNTLLCLDCPQYEHRSITDDQDLYTFIKPTDIDEFYSYVTTAGKNICSTTEENPYLKAGLDGEYKGIWTQTRIDKQKNTIQKVCKKFELRQLISAAEILRAIKNKMDFENKESNIFFMQNNLYTWSRQYLIEKIQGKN